MGDDRPYWESWAARRLLELPVHWSLDDWPRFGWSHRRRRQRGRPGRAVRLLARRVRAGPRRAAPHHVHDAPRGHRARAALGPVRPPGRGHRGRRRGLVRPARRRRRARTAGWTDMTRRFTSTVAGPFERGHEFGTVHAATGGRHRQGVPAVLSLGARSTRRAGAAADRGVGTVARRGDPGHRRGRRRPRGARRRHQRPDGAPGPGALWTNAPLWSLSAAGRRAELGLVHRHGRQLAGVDDPVPGRAPGHDDHRVRHRRQDRGERARAGAVQHPAPPRRRGRCGRPVHVVARHILDTAGDVFEGRTVARDAAAAGCAPRPPSRRGRSSAVAAEFWPGRARYGGPRRRRAAVAYQPLPLQPRLRR